MLRVKRSGDGGRGSVMFLTKPGEVDVSADMDTKQIETKSGNVDVSAEVETKPIDTSNMRLVLL